MKRFGILACVRFILVAAGSLHAQQFGNIVGELHVIRGDFPGRILIELQLHGAPIAISTPTNRENLRSVP
jgi:hypothetical protein